MSSHFAAVYDGCVLCPGPLRDLLLHLALSDVYRARWTDMIHDDWIASVGQSNTKLRQDFFDRTREIINSHVRGCVVTGFEYLIPTIAMEHAHRRHVVAAAVHSGAGLIVTFDLEHYPTQTMKPYNLAAQHPDDFILDLLDLHPAAVLEAAANHRRSLKNPITSANEYLDLLLAQGLTQSVATMRQWAVAM